VRRRCFHCSAVAAVHIDCHRLLCGLSRETSCDPDWRIFIFIPCANRVGINGVDGTKDVVYIGGFFSGLEARFVVFGRRGLRYGIWGSRSLLRKGFVKKGVLEKGKTR
jgi:hypothetical protein